MNRFNPHRNALIPPTRFARMLAFFWTSLFIIYLVSLWT
jgi:hypothetical protein